MIRKIDHLGLAVKDLEQRLRFYEDKLGLSVAGRETVRSQGVNVAFIPVGETRLELLEPAAADSPITGFLEKRGEGFHHVCFQVDDIDAAHQRLADSGARLITPKPVPGAEGCRVLFIHPSETGGVLVELSQRLEPPQGETGREPR